MNTVRPLDGLLYDQTDLTRLCAERPLDWSEYAPMNEFHGNASILKRYAELPLERPLPFAVEHAIPYDLESAYEYDLNSGLSMFLAVHEQSAALYKTGPITEAHAIGFTHLYAMELFDQLHPQAAPVERHGTIVFPDKSTLLMDTDFDRASFAARLAALPEEYQPVVVCVYWKDVVRGNHLPFEQAGLPVVTCGHLQDGDFLLRFHDLCRRFRYACANDIAGSFVLSILSGCHFFHLTGGPLTQRGKNEGSFEQDPTLDKPQKASCLLASPFPPDDAAAQRQLAEQLCGKAYQRSVEELRSLYLVAEEALACRLTEGKVLLCGPESRPGLFAFRPVGVDYDSWARKECSLRVGSPNKFSALVIELQLVLGTSSGQTVDVYVTGKHHEQTTAMPQHQTVFVPLPSTGAECEVTLRSNKELALSGESRVRSFRILSLELLPALSARPPWWKRWLSL
jgi:hypothetical protein